MSDDQRLAAIAYIEASYSAEKLEHPATVWLGGEIRKAFDAGIAWARSRTPDPMLAEKIGDLRDFAQHDSWRCGFYVECHCGLDALTADMGLPRVDREVAPDSPLARSLRTEGE